MKHSDLLEDLTVTTIPLVPVESSPFWEGVLKTEHRRRRMRLAIDWADVFIVASALLVIGAGAFTFAVGAGV